MESRLAFKLPIEPLGPHHDRAAFSCGTEALDAYIHQQAGQDVKKKVAATFVQPADDGKAVAGYYTLSATSVQLSDLPPDVAHKLPRYPLVPATLLGRLAVDRKYKGQGLGERLLMDALHRSLGNSEQIGSAVVVVDAKDGDSANFYKRYGFIQFPTQQRHLFLPMKTIEKLFS